MILIEGNWEEVRDLSDVSNLIRYYYNEDLADELNKLNRLIPKHSDEDYYDLQDKIEDLEDENERLQDENYCLDSQNDKLRAQIEKLENELNG